MKIAKGSTAPRFDWIPIWGIYVFAFVKFLVNQVTKNTSVYGNAVISQFVPLWPLAPWLPKYPG